MTSRILAALFAALTVAGAARAQQAEPSPTAPVPAATVPPAASAVPPPISVLPAPVADVPTPTVAPQRVPATPAPSPAPSVPRIAPPVRTPAPVPTPSPPAPAAVDSATPTAAPTPTPTPEPTPAPTLAPIAPAVPTPMPTEPTPEAFEPSIDEADQGGVAGWLLPLAIAVAIGVVVVFLLARRRRDTAAEEQMDVLVDEADESASEAPRAADAAEPPLPAPAFALPPAPAARPRAWLSFDIRPIRAGVNLLTATLEAEVTVRNEGDAAAEDIRLDLRLLSAHGEGDGALEALFDDPVLRGIVPAFALAPGESRTVTRLVTLPRGAINVLTAGGRPMFVPVAAVNLRYVTAGRPAQSAGAVAIGVERAGSEKLAPLWLDVPARMHDSVAARPHATGVRT